MNTATGIPDVDHLHDFAVSVAAAEIAPEHFARVRTLILEAIEKAGAEIGTPDGLPYGVTVSVSYDGSRYCGEHR